MLLVIDSDYRSKDVLVFNFWNLIVTSFHFSMFISNIVSIRGSAKIPFVPCSVFKVLFFDLILPDIGSVRIIEIRDPYLVI